MLLKFLKNICCKITKLRENIGRTKNQEINTLHRWVKQLEQERY